MTAPVTFRLPAYSTTQVTFYAKEYRLAFLRQAGPEASEAGKKSDTFFFSRSSERKKSDSFFRRSGAGFLYTKEYSCRKAFFVSLMLFVQKRKKEAKLRKKEKKADALFRKRRFLKSDTRFSLYFSYAFSQVLGVTRFSATEKLSLFSKYYYKRACKKPKRIIRC